MVYGASAGESGKDTSAQLTYPGRRVGIRGTYNHKIKSIPIETAGRVTKTTIDEVLVIMHQHAFYSKGNTLLTTN